MRIASRLFLLMVRKYVVEGVEKVTLSGAEINSVFGMQVYVLRRERNGLTTPQNVA